MEHVSVIYQKYCSNKSVPWIYHGDIKCWDNKCPFCGGKLKVSTKAGKENGGNQISCAACSADFCPCTGEEAWNPPRGKLTPCTDTSVGSTSSGSTETSYWDALTGVIAQVKADLMVYIHLDVLYVLQIPEPVDNTSVYVDDLINVSKDSVTVTDPKPDTVNQISVSYGSKAGKQSVTSSLPDVIAKYGVKIQNLQQPKMNQAQAQAYAEKQLRIANRTDGLTIDLTILGAPFFYPHSWCDVRLKRYNINTTLFITRFNLKHSSDKIPTADLTLAEYYPDLAVKNSSDTNDPTAGAGSADSANSGSLDAIGKQEAKFRDCQPNTVFNGKNVGGGSSLENSNDIRGCSDCWGSSFWLYQHLNAAGIKTRIIASTSDIHRWVEINENGKWTPFPGYLDTGRKWGGWHHGPGHRTGRVYKNPP